MTAEPFTLASLADRRLWVAWQQENRQDGRPTKVPYSPGGGRARADDCATWGTRADAERRAAVLPKPYKIGGVGIELAPLGDGRSLAGIDLDTCRSVETGELQPWAEDVVIDFGSYAEISPSLTGCKLFFTFPTDALAGLRADMSGSKFGKQFKRGGGGHPPAIELHLGNRYFAVTDDLLPGAAPDIRHVEPATILQLLKIDGPAFARPAEQANAGRKERRTSGVDGSRSTIAFRIGQQVVKQGATFDEMCKALRDHPDTAEWMQEKGQAHAGREARRIFDKATGTEPKGARPDMPASDVTMEDAPSFSDDALATVFSEKYADQLRHVAAWNKWYEWTNTNWTPDPTLATFDRARAICRHASTTCNDLRAGAKVASASTVAAVERLAKADRRHAATVDQWDADPWLLNTPGGTVELKTGRMRQHAAADHITKITAVAPGGECPMWHGFLDRVTNGDAELQAYLARMSGYALTGSIREHALFFAYGTGANGKGVTINTLTGILGDYAAVASIETFTASTSDRHPTDLAMLRGARLVTAQETEEGRRWAESRIKAMTGGDPITARFMRQDFFTFAPTFKLLIAGNHRPGLRNVDEAIRRRFNLIPFSVKIPPAERDLDLPEKLKAEWPGILAWAIEGCLEWQRIGLAAPQAVVAATAEYLEAEDATATWMSDCCIAHGSLHSSSSVLFASWKIWAETAGEHTGSQKGFSQKLVANGFEARRHPDGRAGFVGLGLKPPAQRYGED